MVCGQLFFFFTILAIELCFLPNVNSWGIAGHKTVASVAEGLLNTAASNRVKDLLSSFTAFQATSLADIAVWADDYGHSDAGKWSSPNHFLNVDRVDPTISFKYCAQFCAVKAILNYTQLLTQKTLSKSDQAIALAFLVHFTGDAHQPLHISYLDDLGGNTVTVDFFGTPRNLHSVWDTYMIDKYLNGQSRWANLAKEINDMIRQNPQSAKAKDPALTWATESLDYTKRIVYTYPGLSGAPAGMTQLKYYTDNMVIVKQRILLASVRLGALLNQIFSQ